jgi:hypothetical protein
MKYLIWILLLVGTCLGQIVNSGGGGSGTVTNTGGNLTLNAVVLGNGTSDTKVSTGIVTNGASELDVGVSGTNGVFGLNGSTSGKATFTAPAVAGTSTNGVTASNNMLVPSGTNSLPGYAFSANAAFGMYFLGGVGATMAASGTDVVGFVSTGMVVPSNLSYRWSSTGGAGGSADTGLSRTAAGVVSVDTTANGNTLGTIKPGLYASGTNCSAVGTAANPSVASCTAAPAGSFSCATNASTGTCVVNTTAVTANSEIFITQRSDTVTGTKLGVTCNVTLTTVIPEITAVTAATSFTINLGTIAANPECFSYFIVN